MTHDNENSEDEITFENFRGLGLGNLPLRAYQPSHVTSEFQVQILAFLAVLWRDSMILGRLFIARWGTVHTNYFVFEVKVCITDKIFF